MNILKNLIERCHQRHEKPLNQRQTVVTSAPYKGLPYHFTVYCAHRYPVKLYELEESGISFMPIGLTPWNDNGPTDLGGDRFLKRQGIADWIIRHWYKSWEFRYTRVFHPNAMARDGMTLILNMKPYAPHLMLF